MSQFRESSYPAPLLAAFVFYSGSVDWMTPTHPPMLVRVIFFTESTDQNSNFFGDTLTDTHTNHISPALWGLLSPVKLAHEINHHRGRSSHPNCPSLALPLPPEQCVFTKHQALDHPPPEQGLSSGHPSLL